MAHDLARLIRRGDAPRAFRSGVIALAPVDAAILSSDVARRLGKQIDRRPWLSEREALDATFAFLLTFCGAIIFLL